MDCSKDGRAGFGNDPQSRDEEIRSWEANGTEYDEARKKHTNAATQRLTAYYDYMFRTKILDFYAGEPLQ